MRIIIDMQGAQTSSRFRGVGRYTLSFAQAVVRNRGKHEVILALSGLFPETIQPIRAAFHDLLPQENIRIWEVPDPIKEEHPDNDTRRLSAELLREAYLGSLQPDLIHICSLFEGYVDDAVTSIGRFDRTHVSVTLHDLIPLRNPEHYLNGNPRYARYYQHKVAHLKKADCFLAVSEYTRQEGIDCLGVSASKIVNTLEAVEPEFQVLKLEQDTVRVIQDKFGITRSFILYTGGDDERKNLPRLVEAYAALPVGLRSAHQLVFVGPIGKTGELRQLAQDAGLQPEDFLCTGHVSDEELVHLYNLCHLYIFPSWHEGFGLPPLEAMACGAPVIGANTSSLPEVIGLEEALFDPFDVSAITTKLQQALTDEAFLARLREHGRKQVQKFSWDETAKRAIATWESLQRPQPTSCLTISAKHAKPKLAFVSPLPPERTGIADYSAELLPALSQYYQIEVIVDQQDVTDQWIRKTAQLELATGSGKIIVSMIGFSTTLVTTHSTSIHSHCWKRCQVSQCCTTSSNLASKHTGMVVPQRPMYWPKPYTPVMVIVPSWSAIFLPIRGKT
ncbi:glycosyltransferase family 4 protein [Acidithiobacillus sp. M4-SHS-6]|uniref:glycosyltransferase family 4 protein n=1 Tax=Acidithiobacillus sp. M4-SHS-6 TaxID=3383024 RepID=UPI0039BE1BEF